MSLSAAIVALIAGVIVWVLLATKLTARPWETPGAPEDVDAGIAPGVPPAKIGLWILLAVITSLFGLFLSAYSMRMQHAHGDWQAFNVPRLLWLNTALLILSSVAMEFARVAAKRGDAARTRIALIAGGVFAWVFLAGQLVAWRQLWASGYFMGSNPAIAFFFLLTGVHGLHLLGGLLVWGKTVVRMAHAGVEVIDLRLSVELCTVYWHFLLLVWLVLFTVLLST